MICKTRKGEHRVWQPKKSCSDGVMRKIGELKNGVSPHSLPEAYDCSDGPGICFHAEFSPCQNYFAWVPNPTRVVLVPWDRKNNCLYTDSPKANLIDANSQRKAVVLDCSSPVTAVAFGSCAKNNPNNKSFWKRHSLSSNIIATGHRNGRIRIWSVDTARLLLELVDHKATVRDLAFAPDNSLRLISASSDATLKAWDLNDDGNMFKTFRDHSLSVLSCAWSPNSKLLASSGNDKNVIVWDMNTYKMLNKLRGHSNSVASCCFSPDGAILASASWDTQAMLWDPYLGTRLKSLCHLYPPPNMIFASGANSSWVLGVSFSNDGTHVVTISSDHLIRFWNMMGDEDPEGISSEQDEVLCCSYAPSGQCVAVGTNQSKVTFYLAPQSMPRLTHLSRMAIRKRIPTQDIDVLTIPEIIKDYLKYKIWV